MVSAITAVASAGPEDVLRPRFWLDQTVNARGRVLLDNGDSVQGDGVSFLFRWVADRRVQIELAGIWDPAAQMWLCPAELPRIGAWEMRMVCLSPQRQTDWMTLDMVATPGTGASPGGGLWVTQQGQALVTMSGAGLTGVRILELLLATEPDGVTLPGVASDGADVRVPWSLLAYGAREVALAAVATKADQTDLEALALRVDDKAEAGDLTALQGRVDGQAETVSLHEAQIADLDMASGQQASDLADLKAAASTLGDSIEDLTSASAQQGERLNLVGEGLAALEGAVGTLGQRAGALETEAQRVQTELVLLQRAGVAAAETLAQIEAVNTDQTAELVAIRAQAESLRLLIEALDAADDGQLADLTEITQAIGRHSGRLDALEATAAQHVVRLRELGDDLTALQTTVTEQGAALTGLQQVVSALQEQAGEQDGAVQALERRVEAGEGRQQSIELAFRRFDEALEALQDDVASQVSAISRLQADSVVHGQRLADLVEVNAAQNARLTALEQGLPGSEIPDGVLDGIIQENARQAAAIAALQSLAEQQAASLQNLAQVDVQSVARLTALEGADRGHAADIAALRQASSAMASGLAVVQALQTGQQGAIATLESKVAALQRAADQASAADAAQDQSIAALQAAQQSLSRTVVEQTARIAEQQSVIAGLRDDSAAQLARIRDLELTAAGLLSRIIALEAGKVPDPVSFALAFSEPENSGYLILF